MVSATQTVDRDAHGGDTVAFRRVRGLFFPRRVCAGDERGLRWLLVGLLAAFAFCLVRAVEQRLIEFPQDQQFLVEGERTGWTNIPPEVLMQLKADQFIITTNGVDVANPVILTKFAKGRVHGTLVYPNALAGVVLLLLPLLRLCWRST